MHQLLGFLSLLVIHSQAKTSSGSSAQDGGLVSTAAFATPSAQSRLITAIPSSAESTVNCSASWESWLVARNDFTVSDYTFFPTTYTYHNMTAQLTVHCDGHTRIVGGSNGLTTTATGTTSSMTYLTFMRTQNFSSPTPSCTPPPVERESILLQWNVWVPNTAQNRTANFTVATSSSTVYHSPDCGPCSIFGGTVQLLYFHTTPVPPHTLCPTNSPGSPTLCPLAPTIHPYTITAPYESSPCAYNTSGMTSTENSGPYIVSDGNTFYQNRAYISINTAFATNGCGFVGNQHPGTLLTMLSSDVYTVAGYHHEFRDIGWTVNYDDFTSVPSVAYYLNCNLASSGGNFCQYSGTRYRPGTDFINGMSTIDFGNAYEPAVVSDQWIWDFAYAPTLLVPLQIRQLETAWSTCSLNLNGLYDPPRLLTNSLIFPTPTTPGVKPTTPAAPASSLQGGPRETASNPTHPASNPTAHPSKASQTSGPQQVGGSPPTVPGTSDPSQDGPKQPSKTNDPPNSAESHTGLPSVASRSSSAANDPASSSSPTTHNILAAVATFTISHHLHTISVLPSTVGLYAIDNQYTVTTGDPAVIIDGMPITISSLDSLVIGDRTMDLPQDSQDDGDCTTTFDEGSAVHTIIHLPGSKALYLLDDSYTVAEGSPTTVVDSMHLYIGAYARVIAGQQTMTLAASLASSSGGTVGKETSRGPAASPVGSASLTPSASASSTSGGSRKAQLCRITILMSLSITFVALLR